MVLISKKMNFVKNFTFDVRSEIRYQKCKFWTWGPSIKYVRPKLSSLALPHPSTPYDVIVRIKQPFLPTFLADPSPPGVSVLYEWPHGQISWLMSIIFSQLSFSRVRATMSGWEITGETLMQLLTSAWIPMNMNSGNSGESDQSDK